MCSTLLKTQPKSKAVKPNAIAAAIFLLCGLVCSPCLNEPLIASSGFFQQKPDAAEEDPLPEKISFNFHVRSILSENCFFCHGPDPNHREAELRLDTKEGYRSVVEPGDASASELLSRVCDVDEDVVMPPPGSGRTLTARQKEILKRWIQQGAKYEDHWAFQAPEKTSVPTTKDNRWPRNAIDQFVLAKLERRNIKPSPRAKPEVLVRRLHLDLIGLPPQPQETRDFVAAYSQDADQAIESLVDRLLQSPHYGERMALPWLDAARYADSNGFQQDGDRTQWPWRDWVVDALNSNMPFDQFTTEQLAGDLLPKPSQDQLIATAFNRNHMLNGEGGAIAEEQRNNYVFDRVDTTSTTWLGLTMACAQCHDHKYDPITQEDYYRFFAYFNNVDERGGVDRRVGRHQCAKPFIQLPTEAQTKAIADIDAKIQPLRKQLRDLDKDITAAMRDWEVEARKNPAPPNMPRGIFNVLVKVGKERSKQDDNRLKAWYLENVAKDQWRKIKQQENKLGRQRSNQQSKVLTVMVMREQPNPRSTYILQRGNYEARGKQVTASIPHFLPSSGINEESTRLDLARWLVSQANPLTSRVQVNRYWQTFFGVGLVKTSEDFGVQGELPSHPELLDWLAVDFRENGWNVKRLHRMIATSETYLQSSKFRKDLIEIDPENRLLARSPRYRLPSALIRDSALSASGLLNGKLGGPPVYPYQPDRLWKEFSLEKFGYQVSKGDDLYRRSLYTFWRRTVAPPNMFDASNRQTCTVKLSRTNTPLHALTLLNDPTYVEAAGYLANEVIAQSDDSSQNRSGDAGLITSAFFQCLGRQPNDAELKSLTEAMHESREFFSSDREAAKQFISNCKAVKVPEDPKKLESLAALSSVAQILFNTDEFMTRE